MLNQSNSFNEFLRGEQAKRNSVTTGMALLDRAFKIPLRKTLLIRSERYAGGTAIALECCRSLLAQGHEIIYTDINSSLYSHRIKDLISDSFHVLKPTSAKEILDVTRTFANTLDKPVLVLDGIKNINTDWSLKYNFYELATSVRCLDPNYTVICIIDSTNQVGGYWTSVVDIHKIDPITDDREKFGHIAKITGSLGQSKVYIEYLTGRVSKSYEEATLKIEAGTHKPNSLFSTVDNSLTVQGFWNYVKQADYKYFNET